MEFFYGKESFGLIWVSNRWIRRWFGFMYIL